jgi:uncharacterized protein YqgC (DUF456 family)
LFYGIFRLDYCDCHVYYCICRTRISDHSIGPLHIGPFVIPVAGILVGPFLGAIIAELVVSRSGVKQAVKTGIGSLVGFFTSVVTKGLVMVVMIAVFIFFIK